MSEDLIGYLLGAVDDAERHRIEQRLLVDPALREQLAKLRLALDSLDASHDGFVPPSDLVQRTLDSIPPVPSQAASRGQSHRLVGDDSTGRSAAHRRWDALAIAAASIAIFAIAWPLLLQSRSLTRRQQCADQLSRLGQSLNWVAMKSPTRRLPMVGQQGRTAFAGIYAVVLREHGMLDQDSIVWCRDEGTRPDQWRIPTLREVHEGDSSQWMQWARTSGGSYTYSLGVTDEQGQYMAAKFEGRSQFALMSDTPIRTTQPDRTAHDGLGINVLYEDGSVRWTPIVRLTLHPTNPLLNDDGNLAAGRNIDDSALGPSWQSPFPITNASAIGFP
jgi:hypothetical protein